MQRILLVLFILLVAVVPAEAANQLYNYNASKEASQAGQILWKLSGVGKVTEDIVIAPNGNLLLSIGSKLICLNPQGKTLWEAKSVSGSMGKPVPVPNGSIYTASGRAVQETKINGASGWSYAVYSESKGNKKGMLAGGDENIIYLPLPDGMYAVDTSGHHAWIFSPWETSGGKSIKVNDPQTILACTADKQAVYVAYGDKEGYKLAAIDKQGKNLWSFWLGDINRVYLDIDNNSQLIASVSFNGGTSDKSNICKIYCFRPTDGKMTIWTSSFIISNELSQPYIAADNNIYVSGGSKIFAVEGSSGRVLWDSTILNLVSPPAAGHESGRIYAGNSDGKLFAVNKSGRRVWSRQLDSAIEKVPLIGPGKYIYVVTKKGSLYKILDSFKES